MGLGIGQFALRNPSSHAATDLTIETPAIPELDTRGFLRGKVAQQAKTQ
jgi:hypothetical protein